MSETISVESAPKNSGKKKLYLSASRIDTFLNCSVLYAAKYIFKLPDSGNDGSKRGSVCHDTLELLAKPRHYQRYSDALHHQTCKEVPALWRYITLLAKSYGVADESNLDMIDAFIMTALNNEFFGKKDVVKIEAEREFNMDVDEGGIKYSARGFIDKIFYYLDRIEIMDFKSSKGKFEGEKETFNIQANIYQAAAKRLFPEFAKRTFRFLFMKFPRAPWQVAETLSDKAIAGFELYLTELHRAMSEFNEQHMLSHPAADEQEKMWLCGREGVKKDGSTAWICSVRKPMDYWVILGADNEIVESAFTSEELEGKLKDGNRIEKRRWKGCPHYYDQKTERKIRF